MANVSNIKHAVAEIYLCLLKMADYMECLHSVLMLLFHLHLLYIITIAFHYESQLQLVYFMKL